jgi:hypothetical protein
LWIRRDTPIHNSREEFGCVLKVIAGRLESTGLSAVGGPRQRPPRLLIFMTILQGFLAA